MSHNNTLEQPNPIDQRDNNSLPPEVPHAALQRPRSVVFATQGTPPRRIPSPNRPTSSNYFAGTYVSAAHRQNTPNTPDTSDSPNIPVPANPPSLPNPPNPSSLPTSPGPPSIPNLSNPSDQADSFNPFNPPADKPYDPLVGVIAGSTASLVNPHGQLASPFVSIPSVGSSNSPTSFSSTNPSLPEPIHEPWPRDTPEQVSRTGNLNVNIQPPELPSTPRTFSSPLPNDPRISTQSNTNNNGPSIDYIVPTVTPQCIWPQVRHSDPSPTPTFQQPRIERTTRERLTPPRRQEEEQLATHSRMQHIDPSPAPQQPRVERLLSTRMLAPIHSSVRVEEGKQDARNMSPPNMPPLPHVERSVGERLEPTLTTAKAERDKYASRAKLTSYALNIAIGLQVILGALTTGLAATRGSQVGTAILGGISVVVASYLARARGSKEPESSVIHVKDLEQFIRECEAFIMDYGYLVDHKHDERLDHFRRRFEEILGNVNQEREVVSKA